MPRNKIMLKKKKNEKTLKKKCKSKKKRSFRNKKKLRGGNDPVTNYDVLRKVEQENEIQVKMTLLGDFLYNKLIPERDTFGIRLRSFFDMPTQAENYKHEKSAVMKSIQELISDVQGVNTIAKSLAEEDLNDDNRKKKKEILNKSDLVLKELIAISETLSNHTENTTRDNIMPLTYTITPIR